MTKRKLKRAGLTTAVLATSQLVTTASPPTTSVPKVGPQPVPSTESVS